MKKGFTLLEIVLVVAISAVILGIVLFSFAGYRNREILKSTTLQVVSILRDARAKTLVAEGDSVYGVHFDVDQIILFTGSSYSPNSISNETTTIPSAIGLATTSLGATDVVFNRLSGEPSVTGEIYIYRLAEPQASTTVTINGAGIISSP